MFSTEEEEKSRLWYIADAQTSNQIQASRFGNLYPVKAKTAVKPLPTDFNSTTKIKKAA